MDWALPGLGRLFGQDKGARPVALGTRLLDMLANWSERRQQRMMLGRMDDYGLSDIGVSRGDAIEEANKPFWRS